MAHYLVFICVTQLINPKLFYLCWTTSVFLWKNPLQWYLNFLSSTAEHKISNVCQALGFIEL